MEKKRLREKYTTLRQALSTDEVEDFSLQIANNTLTLPIWEVTNYHIFLPIINKQEVNTEYLLHILQGKDKTIVIPKANFSTGEMTHYLLQENTVLTVSGYGIPEPHSGIAIPPDQLDVIFVPLMAYDKVGNRIGYGKGFYDRFLAQCNPKAVFIGLSFYDPEVVLPTTPNDVPLNFCITPKRAIKF